MTRMQTITALSLLLLAPATAIAQRDGAKASSPEAPRTIVETAVAAGSFGTLVQAVQAAGLAEALSGEGPFTVFAPTDAAFAKLPKGTLETLLRPENKDRLTAILTYHVVAGRVAAKDAIGLRGAVTLNGQQLEFDTSLRGLRVDGAKVVDTDIACSNGLIHVVDAVLLPSDDTIPAVAKSASKGKNGPRFTTLLAAVEAAGLADTLDGDGPFTVFAPTDQAFAALPDGTLDMLLLPENRSKLVEILKLHVVAGRVFARDAIAAGMAKSLSGKTLKITFDEDGARVGEARLLQTDLDASNGVIHVIDRVLLPERLSRMGAVRALEDAVARGSELFNQGHTRQCARLYADTCKTIVAEAGPEVAPAALRILALNVDVAAAEHDSRQRAWRLRHGIDLAFRALQDGAVMVARR
ncbi:MAG: fasciclin domain-containing protein [Planctomycetota bacterium]